LENQLVSQVYVIDKNSKDDHYYLLKVVDERCLLVIVQRVQRINQIWKLLNDQIALLETMAPTDFLDFRGYLSTASGFQSLQFRIFENKFGLSPVIKTIY
jgi:tryptophan 2,3-dioxygenase